MAGFAIMRCAKVKSKGGCASSMKHNFRERETPNADPELTPQNEHWACRSTDEAMGKLNNLLPEKHRKDAVLAVEYVFSASPDWMQNATDQEQADFFKASLSWLQDKYGAKNIIMASIHRDETTPHMAAMVVPVTEDGRLCAKDFIGGRDKLRADQTSFAAKVSHLGLKRGQEQSRATHQRVKSFYGAINTSKDKDQAAKFREDLKSGLDDKPVVFEEKKIFGLKISDRRELPQDIADRKEKAIENASQVLGDIALQLQQETERADKNQNQSEDAQRYLKILEKLRDDFGSKEAIFEAAREAKDKRERARLLSRQQEQSRDRDGGYEL